MAIFGRMELKSRAKNRWKTRERETNLRGIKGAQIIQLRSRGNADKEKT